MFCGMTLKGMTYDEKKSAGERLLLACTELSNTEEQLVGSYRGFALSLRFEPFRSEYQAGIKRPPAHSGIAGHQPPRQHHPAGQCPERLCRPHRPRRERAGQPESAAAGSAGRGRKALSAGGRTGGKVRSPCGAERAAGYGGKPSPKPEQAEDLPPPFRSVYPGKNG